MHFVGWRGGSRSDRIDPFQSCQIARNPAKKIENEVCALPSTMSNSDKLTDEGDEGRIE